MTLWRFARLMLGGVFLAAMLVSCGERVTSNVKATATPIETQAPEEGVKAISDLEAYVFTADSVLHTTDGGTSWSDASPTGHPAIAGWFFLDSEHGWLVSQEEGQLGIWATGDGGKSWDHSTAPLASPDGIGAAYLDFIDSSRGWLTTTLPGLLPRSAVYATQDGGRSWQMQGLSRLAGPITFVDATRGWGVGDGSKLYTTEDSGQSWTLVQLPVPKGYEDGFLSVAPAQFTSSTDGVVEALVSGSNSALFADITHDGAVTWMPTAPLPVDLSGIQSPPAFWAMDSQHWFVALSAGLEVTQNAGATWQSVTPNMSLAGTWSLDFTAQESGWALVGNGSCAGYKTDCTDSTLAARASDGGETWTTELANTRPAG